LVRAAPPNDKENVMQWITIATPPFGLEKFDKVRDQFSEEPEGLEARYVGTTDGSLRVITVWETKEHADRFFADTLGPALAKALGPEPVGMPETVGIEVARSFVRQPIA